MVVGPSGHWHSPRSQALPRASAPSLCAQPALPVSRHAVTLLAPMQDGVGGDFSAAAPRLPLVTSQRTPHVTTPPQTSHPKLNHHDSISTCATPVALSTVCGGVAIGASDDGQIPIPYERGGAGDGPAPLAAAGAAALPPDPAALTSWIKSSRNMSRLQRLLNQYGNQMNHIHVSAVVTHLSQLACEDAPTAAALTAAVGAAVAADSISRGHSGPATHLEGLDAEPGSPHDGPAGPASSAASDSPAAAAATSHAAETSDPAVARAFLAALLLRIHEQLPYFEPRQLSNTGWALGKWPAGLPGRDEALTAVLSASRPQLPRFRAQELANLLHGWASCAAAARVSTTTGTVGVTSCVSTTAQLYLGSCPPPPCQSTSANQQGESAGENPWVNPLEQGQGQFQTLGFLGTHARACVPLLRQGRFKMQELSNLLWSWGLLLGGGAAVDGAGGEGGALLAGGSSASSAPPGGLTVPYRELLAAQMRLGLMTAGPQELANSMLSLARLQLLPPREWFESFLKASRTHLVSEDGGAVTARPTSRFHSATPYSTSDAAATASTAAAAGGGGGLAGRDGSSSRGPSRVGFSPQELSNLLWGCSKLQLRLPYAFLDDLEPALERSLPAMALQERVNVLWALAWQAKLGAGDWVRWEDGDGKAAEAIESETAETGFEPEAAAMPDTSPERGWMASGARDAGIGATAGARASAREISRVAPDALGAVGTEPRGLGSPCPSGSVAGGDDEGPDALPGPGGHDRDSAGAVTCGSQVGAAQEGVEAELWAAKGDGKAADGCRTTEEADGAAQAGSNAGADGAWRRRSAPEPGGAVKAAGAGSGDLPARRQWESDLARNHGGAAASPGALPGVESGDPDPHPPPEVLFAAAPSSRGSLANGVESSCPTPGGGTTGVDSRKRMVRRVVHAVLGPLQSSPAVSGPQDVSVALWSVATLTAAAGGGGGSGGAAAGSGVAVGWGPGDGGDGLVGGDGADDAAGSGALVTAAEVDTLVRLWCSRLGDMPPQGQANCVWAAAQLRLRLPAELQARLAAWLARRATDLSPTESAAVLRSLGLLCSQLRPTPEIARAAVALLDQAYRRHSRYSLGELVQVCHGGALLLRWLGRVRSGAGAVAAADDMLGALSEPDGEGIRHQQPLPAATAIRIGAELAEASGGVDWGSSSGGGGGGMTAAWDASSVVATAAAAAQQRRLAQSLDALLARLQQAYGHTKGGRAARARVAAAAPADEGAAWSLSSAPGMDVLVMTLEAVTVVLPHHVGLTRGSELSAWCQDLVRVHARRALTEVPRHVRFLAPLLHACAAAAVSSVRLARARKLAAAQRRRLAASAEAGQARSSMDEFTRSGRLAQRREERLLQRQAAQEKQKNQEQQEPLPPQPLQPPPQQQQQPQQLQPPQPQPPQPPQPQQQQQPQQVGAGPSGAQMVGPSPQSPSWAASGLSHDWLQRFWAASTPSLHEAAPHEAAMMLWAMWALAIQPPDPWVRALLRAVEPRLRPGTARGGGGGGSGRRGCAPVSDQTLGVLLLSLGHLRVRPSPQWMTAAMQAVDDWAGATGPGGRSREMDPAAVLGVLCGLALLEWPLPAEWLARLVRAVAPQLGRLRAEDRSRAYVAVATLDAGLAERVGFEFSELLADGRAGPRGGAGAPWSGIGAGGPDWERGEEGAAQQRTLFSRARGGW